jgi:hypothetical protein
MSREKREFKNLEGGGLDFNRVFHRLAVSTEQSKENARSGYPVRWPRFEPSTTQDTSLAV